MNPWRQVYAIVMSVIVGLVVAVSPASGQCRFAKLLASDGVAGDYFGYSVAVSGNAYVVGAINVDDNGHHAGAAYVLRYLPGTPGTWVEEAKLLASDGDEDDRFGTSVAVSDDILVVGAPDDEDNGFESGSAYVFANSNGTWVQQAKLHPDDAEGDDRFGWSVAVEGTTVAIGCPGKDDAGQLTGAVYIFSFDGFNWTQQAKLTASDGAALRLLGISVAMSGGTLLAGSSAGAYVFEEPPGGWVDMTETAKLVASDIGAGGEFGDSVSLSGDVAVIGAPGFASAYVFRFDGLNWLEEAKLLPSGGDPDDECGSAVAVSGDIAMVGAPEWGWMREEGLVYVFTRVPGPPATWVEQDHLTAMGSGGDYALFGEGVAMFGDMAIVGMPADDLSGDASGSVSVYDMTGLDCNANLICDSVDIALGDSPDCNSNGVPDECDIDAGTSWDCNNNGTPEECEFAAGLIPDCNSNGDPDTCDLTQGTSPDCNGNDVPDECDIAGTSSPDCNTNGVPDECDIAGGTSADCQANDLPDECDIAAGTNHDCNNDGMADECPRYGEELGAPPGGSLHYFGRSIALSSDLAAIAVPGTSPEAVFVYRLSGPTWEPEAVLSPSDWYWSQYFADAVALSEETVVAGAPYDDEKTTNAGAAYVFRFTENTWIEEQKLVATDGTYNDYFGTSVAISGEVAVIGAYSDGDMAGSSGSAYIFRFDGSQWAQEGKLYPSDGSSHFGYSVAIVDDVAVIGAHYDDEMGYAYGAAYVFRFNGSTWMEEQKLLPPEGSYFGYSVAIFGDVVIIGAYGDSEMGISAGAAYVFRYNGATWMREAKLLASDGEENDYFGYAVSISGDFAVVGAYGDDDEIGRNLAGSAYLFRHDEESWTQIGKMVAFDAYQGDSFGKAVGLSEKTVMVGAPNKDDNEGAVYVFHHLDCNENRVLDECDILAGTSTDCNSNGIPDECEEDCNANGIPDECDILAGTSADCTSNAIPDECEEDCNANGEADSCDIAFGTSNDCNANLRPDECDVDQGTYPDCNGNIVPDGCDITAGTSPDCNTDGMPDECEADCNSNGVADECDVPPIGSGGDFNQDLVPDECQVVNLTQSSAYPTIPEALADAVDDDELLSAASLFDETTIDFLDKSVTLRSRGEINQPNGGSIIMADESALLADSGRYLSLGGSLLVGFGERVEISGQPFGIPAGGLLTASAASVVDITGSTYSISAGSIEIDVLASVGFSGSLSQTGQVILGGGSLTASAISNAGDFEFADGNIQTFMLTNTAPDGYLVGYGDILGSVTNESEVVIMADTQVTGVYYFNNGTTTIQNGVLSLFGILVNNGLIIGDFFEGLRAGDNGLFVEGSFVAGADATLLMPSGAPIVRIGLDYDVAINSNFRYDMASAELRMVGTGSIQALELMSEDIGPDPAGLIRTKSRRYPLGTLRVGPTQATVALVDNRDNDGLGQGACEALYVRDLIIESGSTLIMSGCKVYYETLTLNGVVDDPKNLVEIVWPFGDFDRDGDVDLFDYAAFADCLEGPGTIPDPTLPLTPYDCLEFDSDTDIDVDLADYQEFEAAFTGP